MRSYFTAHDRQELRKCVKILMDQYRTLDSTSDRSFFAALIKEVHNNIKIEQARWARKGEIE